ncbi:hypothetical protein E2C01_060479 [Portunus trituberculatus]|uniref:Uncharacterized protein n=1 Tax=Portunus trituberculatus TaxID=210409 RepID=A0A5B7H5D4_PORTR|nr:hypothetical protein [Portunus trituberculatus]
MLSCPFSFFCHQHQIFLVYLSSVIYYFIHCY